MENCYQCPSNVSTWLQASRPGYAMYADCKIMKQPDACTRSLVATAPQSLHTVTVRLSPAVSLKTMPILMESEFSHSRSKTLSVLKYLNLSSSQTARSFCIVMSAVHHPPHISISESGPSYSGFLAVSKHSKQNISPTSHPGLGVVSSSLFRGGVLASGISALWLVDGAGSGIGNNGGVPDRCSE
ncbi:hypothetical protein Tco_0276483 [Tanacetum coccineum]